MPVLKSLSFTALPKSGNDTVRKRRTKFITKLEEQKLLLKDPKHFRTVQRWTKVNGEPQATTKQQAVRPWWKTDRWSGGDVDQVWGEAHRIREGQDRHRSPVQGRAPDRDRHTDRCVRAGELVYDCSAKRLTRKPSARSGRLPDRLSRAMDEHRRPALSCLHASGTQMMASGVSHVASSPSS